MPLLDHVSVIDLNTTVQAFGVNPLISKKDQKYINRFRNKNRQKTTLLIRQVARHLLCRITGIPETQWEFFVEKSNNRIAVSTGGDTRHISFSHSPNLGAFAISPKPIGIDIEEEKANRPWREMIDYLGLPENMLPLKDQNDFLRYWTAREAQLKFESASNEAITFHHYHPRPDAVLCLASSFGSQPPPKLELFP